MYIRSRSYLVIYLCNRGFTFYPNRYMVACVCNSYPRMRGCLVRPGPGCSCCDFIQGMNLTVQWHLPSGVWLSSGVEVLRILAFVAPEEDTLYTGRLRNCSCSSLRQSLHVRGNHLLHEQVIGYLNIQYRSHAHIAQRVLYLSGTLVYDRSRRDSTAISITCVLLQVKIQNLMVENICLNSSCISFSFQVSFSGTIRGEHSSQQQLHIVQFGNR